MEKVVEMKAAKAKKVQEEKKLSYEELEGIARQLSMQVQNLTQRLQERDMDITFKRLDYLFKVIEFNKLFPTDFVTKSVDEVMEIMTPVQEEKEEEK